MRILVIRNDKLGDFMLAYPAFALIKRSLPDSEVVGLVPEYTREMAELCPWIDRVLVDPGGHGFNAARRLARLVAQEKFDAAIALYSSARIALALALARVPHRLAPATKSFQVFYTHRVTQRRSRSAKPEWEYNVDLARCFLESGETQTSPLPGPPYLQIPAHEVAEQRTQVLANSSWPDDAVLVFIHAGSGGSARNLSPDQFAALARELTGGNPRVRVVFTAGPAEVRAARSLAAPFGARAAVFESTAGLRAFTARIAAADVFVSGSTGPLHIAGALDRPTAAFYTRRRSATSLRWQTLNSPERRLAFAPPDSAADEDMRSINVQSAAAVIAEAYLSR